VRDEAFVTDCDCDARQTWPTASNQTTGAGSIRTQKVLVTEDLAGARGSSSRGCKSDHMRVSVVKWVRGAACLPFGI
jgi:hypothetical protein